MIRLGLAVVSAFILLATGDLKAASAPGPGGFLPAIAIAIVEPPDLDAYLERVGTINAAMKARHDVPLFLRIYAGVAVGEGGAPYFALSPAGSFAALQQNQQAFADDTDLADARAHLAALHATGARTLLQAVRFDGTHAPGWLLNTLASVSDEAGYLAAIARLRARFDEHEFTDARLNVFRVVAGRSTYTHLFSINLPSAARLATVLDALSTEPWAVEWSIGSSAHHTVVRSGTYREITP